MDSPLTELANALRVWLDRHRLDTDNVRVVLSFDNARDMHEAERAVKADEMWRVGVRMHDVYDFLQQRRVRVCGVDIRLESRKDR